MGSRTLSSGFNSYIFVDLSRNVAVNKKRDRRRRERENNFLWHGLKHPEHLLDLSALSSPGD